MRLAPSPGDLERTILVTSTRRLALAAGVFYLLTFAFSIPAYFLYEPVLTDPEYITGAGGADTRIILGAIGELLTALAGIGTAVAVFPIIRRQTTAFSLGFVTTRIYEAAVMVVGVIALLTIVSLRQDGIAGSDPAALTALGRVLVDVRDHAARLGPGLAPALNAICFGYALYASRLVPRLIPTLGLIGAPLLLVSVFGRMLGIHGDQSAFAAIALAPIFFWELSIGLWMTFKGFNESALAELGYRSGTSGKAPLAPTSAVAREGTA
jgi:hypothetical protein